MTFFIPIDFAIGAKSFTSLGRFKIIQSGLIFFRIFLASFLLRGFRKERLLESFPENLRDKMSKLDSETLEEMKTEFTNKVPQVDNSGGGVSGGKSLEWSKLPPNERKKHFADIMRKNNN